MPERITFTKRAIEGLPLPSAGNRGYYHHDTKVNGLLVCVTSHGIKSFQVYRKLNNKPLRVALGHFPDMTIEQAKRGAQAALSKMAEGIKKTAKARSVTLEDAFKAYLKSRDLKPRTIQDYRAIMVEFTLHDLRQTFITIAESLDIPAYALKRLLNHKPGAGRNRGLHRYRRGAVARSHTEDHRFHPERGRHPSPW